MDKDTALRLALEALKEDRAWLETDAPTEVWEKNNEAITAIKQALAHEALDKKAENARELGLDYEPVQEPVAWEMIALKFATGRKITYRKPTNVPSYVEVRPLYTTPPQRKPLTDEEIDAIEFKALGSGPLASFRDYARRIEAAHGIKETEV